MVRPYRPLVTTESGVGVARPPTVWFGLGGALVIDRFTAVVVDVRCVR